MHEEQYFVRNAMYHHFNVSETCEVVVSTQPVTFIESYGEKSMKGVQVHVSITDGSGQILIPRTTYEEEANLLEALEKLGWTQKF